MFRLDGNIVKIFGYGTAMTADIFANRKVNLNTGLKPDLAFRLSFGLKFWF